LSSSNPNRTPDRDRVRSIIMANTRSTTSYIGLRSTPRASVPVGGWRFYVRGKTKNNNNNIIVLFRRNGKTRFFLFIFYCFSASFFFFLGYPSPATPLRGQQGLFNRFTLFYVNKRNTSDHFGVVAAARKRPPRSAAYAPVYNSLNEGSNRVWSTCQNAI